MTTSITHDELKHQYEHEGKTVRRIAAELELAYGTVYNWLKRAGVTMRPRGGSLRKPRVDIDTAKLAHMYTTRYMSLAEISAEVGMSETPIHRRLREHGVPMRPPGARRKTTHNTSPKTRNIP